MPGDLKQMEEAHLRGILASANDLIAQTHSEFSPINPTEFFCEGWLTSLVLRLATQGIDLLPFGFDSNARWARELGMRSWLKTSRKSRVGTTWADAVVGQIGIRPNTRRGLSIAGDAKQFVVIEAKITSPLSAGTHNADGFDQAARNVICMAIELHEHGLSVDQFSSLAFYVASPAEFVELHRSLVTTDNVIGKFDARVAELSAPEQDEAAQLLEGTLRPLLNRITLECLAWEDIVEKAVACSPDEGAWLAAYYEQTMTFSGQPN